MHETEAPPYATTYFPEYAPNFHSTPFFQIDREIHSTVAVVAPLKEILSLFPCILIRLMRKYLRVEANKRYNFILQLGFVWVLLRTMMPQLDC